MIISLLSLAIYTDTGHLGWQETLFCANGCAKPIFLFFQLSVRPNNSHCTVKKHVDKIPEKTGLPRYFQMEPDLNPVDGYPEIRTNFWIDPEVRKITYYGTFWALCNGITR